ncbi:Kringle domain [Mactra antiquata]
MAKEMHGCNNHRHYNRHYQPSIRTSVSYGEFEGSSTSGSPCPSRSRETHSAASSTVESTDRKKKRYHRKPRDQNGGEETRSSGYNSYSELSEFTSASRNGEYRRSKSHSPNRDTHVHNENEKSDRYTKFPRKNHAKSHDDRMSNISSHGRSDSRHSVTESDISGSSKGKTKKKSRDKVNSTTSETKHVETKGTKVPTIGNVAVTVTNNISYDPNDPFSFIQPVDLPLHVKVRKCMMPILVVISMLILAAALGAAIYFASALKETQEKQIDMLRANLAVKIRSIDQVENIEDLSTGDFKNLSLTYCKHMDLFYARSKFSKTYRGCEVVSIKNSYINFTLFFDEKEATSTQILNVIESSANKVTDATAESQVAVVDQFELELDSVEVKMERRLEPQTFNKKSVIPTTTPKPPPVTEKTKPTSTKVASPSKEVLKTTAQPKPIVTTPDSKKVSPKDQPVYSWNPCAEYEGTYFPHPKDCDTFIQCTNGQMIVSKCAKGLLYHWKELTCVSRFMPNVQCPDPLKVPPKPTTTSATTTTSTSVTTTKANNDETTEAKLETPVTTTKQPTTKSLPDGVVLTAIAGKYAERPKYSANPCENSEDAKLYPHPDDCAKFIQCVNGKVQNMNCAPNLVFDPSNSACIFPTNEDLKCPDIKPCQNKDDGYFPHPYDCSKFIQCQFKKELVLQCQEDLVWSTSVNSCVHKTKSSICPLDPKR